MTDIYNKDRMQCRTNIQQLNTLFEMGKQLEGKVNEFDMGGRTFRNTTIILDSDAWSGSTQTINIEKMTQTATVWVSSEVVNAQPYAASNIQAIAQGDGWLMFKCEDVPVMDLYVTVVWTEI